jgi:hypothetical protein
MRNPALLVGGGGPSGGAFPSRLETSVCAPVDASTQEHCQGGDGTQAGDPVVLDVAEGYEYSQSLEFGSYAEQLGIRHGVK